MIKWKVVAVDMKAVWDGLKGTLPIAIVIVALIAITTESSWPQTLGLAGSILLFVITWDTTKVLSRKRRAHRRSA